MRLALAQINTTVGDLEGNTDKILSYMEQAAAAGADLVCFPELAVTGYPPEDLLLKTSFLEANLRALDKLINASASLDPIAVVGFVDLRDGDIYNAAAVIHRGRLQAVYHKVFLPNYGVFDEKRYFKNGDRGLVFSCAGARVGVTICEDIWHPVGPAVAEIRQSGAQLVLNLSASPYHMGKQTMREKMMSVRAADNLCFLAYVNLVGAQDELVFEGNSLIFDEHGNIIHKGTAFQEDLLLADLETRRILRTRIHDIRNRETWMLSGERVDEVEVTRSRNTPYPPLPEPPRRWWPDSEEAEVYQALVLGVHDYVNKNGFRRVFIGISGGIDSALTAAIATDALGSERVTGVFMPSPITSRESLEDAEQLAANLGIRFLSVPIKQALDAYLSIMAQAVEGCPGDLMVQNLQARIRGNILMALTNQYGGIVLTTGNKSEMSVGYATLYGDMAGGFAVLKDIPKTLVYRLSRHRNAMAGKSLIPERVLIKAPTAELKPDQKDEDDLPPYAVLDQIIQKYVEEDCSASEIRSGGIPSEYLNRAINLIDHNEYKRRQAPPGVKITHRAFGKDRRMPIINHYHDLAE